MQVAERGSHFICLTVSNIYSVGRIQEQSTLDLIGDYSRFVTTFFEVINMSAPHIYHSALPLSPQSSIVRKLYQQYARPFVRVVRGLPISWEPVAATLWTGGHRDKVAWSPCNRFIAVETFRSMDVLDAMTLDRVHSFETPRDLGIKWLDFSPDSRYLTQLGSKGLIRWDLQTGGLLDAIPPGTEEFFMNTSSTYSADGDMVAVIHKVLHTEDDEDGSGHGNNSDDDKDDNNEDEDEDDNSNGSDNSGSGDNHNNISIFFLYAYNLLSGTHTGPYITSAQGRVATPIWTHGECLRFATVKRGSITIWQVAFTLECEPEEVETLPAPEEIVDGGDFLFLPALSRLAITIRHIILVWDAKASKLLLEAKSTPTLDPTWDSSTSCSFSNCSFSSDGRFLASTTDTGAYVWKESSAGYALHQQLAFVTPLTRHRSLLSPNGESIFLLASVATHLWPTKNQILSHSNILTQAMNMANFVLEFSPDRRLAAFVRGKGDTVTIFDLESGDPQLVIDAGMGVECLRLTGSTIVIASKEKIVTWNLPNGNRALNAGMNIDDSVQTTIIDRSTPPPQGYSHLSISPDFRHIVIVVPSSGASGADQGVTGLDLYDVSTGKYLTGTTTTPGLWKPRFTAGGREIWGGAQDSIAKGWEVVEDGDSGATELRFLPPTAYPQEVFPWKSSHGHEVADDWWVLGPTGKRLLWLPHHWRSSGQLWMTWSGQFLGFPHSELPEVIFLEFFE